MPVVINDLEVVAEPPVPAGPPAGPPAPPPAPTALDLADVVRHLDERRERVRAD